MGGMSESREAASASSPNQAWPAELNSGLSINGGRGPQSAPHASSRRRLLSNPLYIGRIAHKGDIYEGQHLAIIDPETWDAVQKQLAAQTPTRSLRAAGSHSNPLRGKLFDEAGALLTPTHSVKSGRRYRYYVSRNSSPIQTTANAAHGRQPGWRLPAREIERLVGEAVASLFGNRAELANAARASQIHEAQVSELLERVQRWNGKPLDVVHSMSCNGSISARRRGSFA
jgi:hypothetical protein